MPSHLNALVKTTKISKALQATQGDLSHGAVTLSSQFSTVDGDLTTFVLCFKTVVTKKNNLSDLSFDLTIRLFSYNDISQEREKTKYTVY